MTDTQITCKGCAYYERVDDYSDFKHVCHLEPVTIVKRDWCRDYHAPRACHHWTKSRVQGGDEDE